MWYIVTVEYHLAINRNEVLVHATQMNLENIMLMERNQIQKSHIVGFHLYEYAE